MMLRRDIPIYNAIFSPGLADGIVLRSLSVANHLMPIRSRHWTSSRRFPRLTTVLLEQYLVCLFIYLMTRLARKFAKLLQYYGNIATVKDKQPSFDEEHRLHQIHPPIRGE